MVRIAIGISYGAGQGILSQSQVPLEKCQNSPADCFSVTSYLVALGVRSHFWFESHFILPKKKSALIGTFFFGAGQGIRTLEYSLKHYTIYNRK